MPLQPQTQNHFYFHAGRPVYLDEEQLQAMNEKIITYQAHQAVAHHQDVVFRQELSTLHKSPESCVIVMDFAAYKRVPLKVDMETCEKTSAVNVLVFCVYRYVKALGCVVPTFIDLVGPEVGWDGAGDADGDGANTFPFFKAGWELLAEHGYLGAFKNITIWSDGGPHHFKVKRSIHFIGELGKALGIKMHWRFFASNHGKGACDGHTAVWTKSMRQQVYNGGHPIESKQDLLEVISSTANTKAHLVRIPPVSNEEVKGMREVKKFHDFFWGDEGQIFCNVLSGEDKGIEVMWLKVVPGKEKELQDEGEELLRTEEQAEREREREEEKKKRKEKAAKKKEVEKEIRVAGEVQWEDSDSEESGSEDSENGDGDADGGNGDGDDVWDGDADADGGNGDDVWDEGSGGGGMEKEEEEEAVGELTKEDEFVWESMDVGRWLVQFVSGTVGRGKKREVVASYRLYAVVGRGHKGGSQGGTWDWVRLRHYRCVKQVSSGDRLAACHDKTGCITSCGRECDVCGSSVCEVSVPDMNQHEWRELTSNECFGKLGVSQCEMRASLTKRLDETIQEHANMFGDNIGEYDRQVLAEVMCRHGASHRFGKRFKL